MAGSKLKSVGQVLATLLFMGWCANKVSTTSSSTAAPTGATQASVTTPTAVQVALPPPEKTTATKVAAAFANNEARAEDYYRDKCFDIDGIVESIDAGIGKDVTLRLRGGIMGVLVSDVRREWGKTLDVGDRVIVSVRGISEVLGQPVAHVNNDCIRASQEADEREKAKVAAAKAERGKAKAAAAKPKAKPASTTTPQEKQARQ